MFATTHVRIRAVRSLHFLFIRLRAPKELRVLENARVHDPSFAEFNAHRYILPLRVRSALAKENDTVVFFNDLATATEFASAETSLAAREQHKRIESQLVESRLCVAYPLGLESSFVD